MANSACTFDSRTQLAGLQLPAKCPDLPTQRCFSVASASLVPAGAHGRQPHDSQLACARRLEPSAKLSNCHGLSIDEASEKSALRLSRSMQGTFLELRKHQTYSRSVERLS